MRILMLTNAMESGGAETHIVSLARSLVRRGHAVTVASAGGAMVKLLRAAGVSHIRLPLDRRGLFSLFAARRGLSRLLRRGAWDVVHAHARLPAFLAAPLCARRGLCLVSTVHAKFPVGWVSRRYTRFGQAAIAVCEELRGHACAHFSLDASDVTVIPNGVDTSHFTPPRARREGGAHVVFMSRLDGDCSLGARLLCRVAPRLTSRFPRLHVTVVGGGDAYGAVKKEAERAISRGASIVLCGRVDDPVSLLRECDVFVGVSRGAMEAMACGA